MIVVAKGKLFFVATNHKGEAKAMPAFEDAVLFERIGATAPGTDATVPMIDVDDDIVTRGEVGGMHGGKHIGTTKAARRKLESIVADDFEATAAIIVKGDATDIGA